MLDRKISFGGEVVPAYIGAAPNIIRAVRKVTVVQVAGTNREIVDMQKAWECYDQPYELFVGDGTADNIQEKLTNVARVLYKDGWQELLDDYEPDIYRLAYYTGPFDVENRHTRLGKFKVSFRCRPERYLRNYGSAVITAAGGTITNPTIYEAKPLIHIVGSGDGTVTIADQTMTFSGLVDYVNVDCDTMDVYRLPAENRNSVMSGSFPVLVEGNNTVSVTGGITSLTITPRFFVI